MTNQINSDQKKMHSVWEIDELEAPPIHLEGSHYSHGHGFHTAKMLREINEDDMTPKKHNFIVQNEVHERIRNDVDYDDWEYGTEPIPLKEWK